MHRGHRVVFTTPVNTGVPGAETAQGIFPIYARYVSTTMSGTDVDGTKYVVPDVPWVNYFNGGDAVHGYPRASYGFPQSNGCVELPIEAAHTVFGMLAIGDIVIGHAEVPSARSPVARPSCRRRRARPPPLLLHRQRAFHAGHPVPGHRAEELVGAGFEFQRQRLGAPWKVGVAPRILPPAASIVTLWRAAPCW